MTLTAGPGLIIFLLFIATLVAIVARRLRLPTMVGLLIAGIGLAFVPWISPAAGLTPHVLFTALLPPLVFEGALNIRWRDLRPDLGLVLTLATVGVAVSLAVVAALMHALVGWPWEAALVFGAIVAATDPISVLASFKEAKVAGRLPLVVEAESLLNDGTAVVAFGLILAVYAAGPQSVVPTLFAGLARTIVGGVAIGLVGGWLLTLLMGTVDDPLAETTLTTVGAYGAYYLADSFGGSGILASVCAGLMMGNVGILGGSYVSVRGREITEGFWTFAAFIANALVFQLMGLTIGHTYLAGRWPIVLAGIASALAGRAATVYSACSLFRGRKTFRLLQAIIDWGGRRPGLPLSIALQLNKFTQGARRVPMALQHVLIWGGQRGALGLVLALSAPKIPGFDHGTLITASFGVVAFSVLVQGMTLSPLLGRVGLLNPSAEITRTAPRRFHGGPPPR